MEAVEDDERGGDARDNGPGQRAEHCSRDFVCQVVLVGEALHQPENEVREDQERDHLQALAAIAAVGLAGVELLHEQTLSDGVDEHGASIDQQQSMGHFVDIHHTRNTGECRVAQGG